MIRSHNENNVVNHRRINDQFIPNFEQEDIINMDNVLDGNPCNYNIYNNSL